MRAVTKEQLQPGDELGVFETINGNRQINVYTVTSTKTKDERVIVDDLYDLDPNEDGHFFKLPKIK